MAWMASGTTRAASNSRVALVPSAPQQIGDTSLTSGRKVVVSGRVPTLAEVRTLLSAAAG